MKRLWRVFRGFNPIARIVVAIAGPLLTILLAWGAYSWLKNSFFGGAEAVRQGAERVIQEELTGAAEETGRAAGEEIVRTYEYRTEQRTIVREGQANVDRAWDGETVGEDVDAAGADALCRLHHSLCRDTGPAGLRPVRAGGAEGGDAARAGPGEQ